MLLKCEKGHELEGDAKFCPQDGTPGKEVQAFRKCGGCQTDQSPEHRHCSKCGTPLFKADPVLDSALGVLTAFAKARTDLTATAAPALDAKTTADMTAVLSALENGEIQDAAPILKAVVASQTQLFTAMGTVMTRLHEGQQSEGTFAKALADGLGAIGMRLGEIDSRLDGIVAADAKPATTRSATVGVVLKADPMALAADATAAAAADESPAGNALLGMMHEKADKFQQGDLTKAQFYTERKMSLGSIIKAEPAFGLRIDQALGVEIKPAAAVSH